MKKLLLTCSLLLSSVAFAETKTVVFPQVWNYGTSVQIQIWNHTDRSISCSGPVYLNMQSGERIHEYFYDFVSARFTSYRTIFSRNMNDRISSVSHMISCF